MTILVRFIKHPVFYPSQIPEMNGSNRKKKSFPHLIFSNCILYSMLLVWQQVATTL